MFARAAGVGPDLEQWPQLAKALLFGPLSPVSFRLSGRDSLPGAAERVAEEAKAFGAIPNGELAPMQQGQLQALAKARNDAGFSKFVQQVCAGQ
jgi:dimethylaniline monooxygenase (N-oxide forming)